MKLFSVLLAALLVGCANTPYRADYTKADIDAAAYKQDRSQCRREAWEYGKQQDATYSDVMLHFVQRKMLACMRDKGYAPVGIHSDAYKQTL